MLLALLVTVVMVAVSPNPILSTMTMVGAAMTTAALVEVTMKISVPLVVLVTAIQAVLLSHGTLLQVEAGKVLYASHVLPWQG